ncbi:MAG: hypothetical protein NDJ92_07420 [Thermoanaerobaculia bacterium]|nr:hypothetical protein [Thermoanaerobaculia bacterium]
MWSSTRFSRRAHGEGERGYALVASLVLAILFFALITLVLWESTMRYRAAQRFRARVVAQTLAENAAELAAKGLGDGSSLIVSVETDEGTLKATGEASPDSEGVVRFRIAGEGTTRGAQPTRATVTVWGRVEAGSVRLTRTKHSQ